MKQELARELGHPDAQKLLSGSMARLAYSGHDIRMPREPAHRDQLAEFEHNVRSTYKQMVRISFEPHWARFYDFGALAGYPLSSRTSSTMASRLAR